MSLNKNSPSYMKSSYERKLYGNENYTTFEREFRIEGKDREEVRAAAPWVKKDVMP
jgi:hypothetical protein